MATRRLTEVRKTEQKPRDSRFNPTCAECGCDMKKKGQVYVCANCGASSAKS